MRYAHLLTTASLCAVFITPALAENEERYRLEKTDTGYVRLDTETGRISLCTEQAGNLVCKMAADDHASYEQDITSLTEKVDALEKRISQLETHPRAQDQLPSEEEFEQTLGYMERFFQRFMGIVGEFDRRFGDEKPTQPSPDRT